MYRNVILPYLAELENDWQLRPYIDLEKVSKSRSVPEFKPIGRKGLYKKKEKGKKFSFSKTPRRNRPRMTDTTNTFCDQIISAAKAQDATVLEVPKQEDVSARLKAYVDAFEASTDENFKTLFSNMQLVTAGHLKAAVQAKAPGSNMDPALERFMFTDELVPTSEGTLERHVSGPRPSNGTSDFRAFASRVESIGENKKGFIYYAYCLLLEGYPDVFNAMMKLVDHNSLTQWSNVKLRERSVRSQNLSNATRQRRKVEVERRKSDDGAVSAPKKSVKKSTKSLPVSSSRVKAHVKASSRHQQDSDVEEDVVDDDMDESAEESGEEEQASHAGKTVRRSSSKSKSVAHSRRH